MTTTERLTATERPTTPPITAGAASDCLLVVDDQEDNIRTLESMLEKLGFKIIPAADGNHALERLTSRPPDLILLNLQVAGMSALELCKKIQENPAWADIPIIFFSAVKDQAQVVQALESGGSDYLSHPFDKGELLSRIRTQLMLKTTRDHLRQLAAEKDELLSMISHYLQNQIAAMNMCSRLLLDQTTSDNRSRFRLLAESIWSASNQIRVFIKTLLANAAADRRFQINLEPVDFSGVVMRSLRQYEDTAHAKDLVLHGDPFNDGLPIKADPAALEQVVDNLISNAIKFSPRGKKISVLMRRNTTHVECHVCDEGPGFTEEDRARMFHRYARLSAQPTGGEPSTGLGLSIAKRLVQAMGGELLCQSVFGEGATFILRFGIHTPSS